ncbi:Actin protein 2/3 complex subunit-like protein [Melia azedarach]|uniref:Actin protein 2/3 complex subunit-like protein n=1 Tax=Melia azedarach TaxID=155640 RepID=A0ACC1YNQ6_MELAZ|nr:Actin protein 2/3 complex subunit-like protein [Melia azedarach]
MLQFSSALIQSGVDGLPTRSGSVKYINQIIVAMLSKAAASASKFQFWRFTLTKFRIWHHFTSNRETTESLIMDLDAPLDFENDDPLLPSPAVNKKRKKIIGAKAQKDYDSDEDENDKEALLSNIVNSCQNQMEDIKVEEEISEWGLQVFGNQKKPPHLDFPKRGSCSLLQSFINNEINTLVELTTDEGETFFEGLLVNGWLSKLVLSSCEVEKSIANWTFNLILYSSKEELRESACEFWCAILSCKNEIDSLPVKIDWFPSFSELNKALVAYGFSYDFSSTGKSVSTDSGCRGPPKNLIAWLKFVAACCRVRSKKSIFSTKEAENLVEVVTCLFLDHQLQGLSVILYECMHSAISYFTDQEWDTSCEKIAKSLACRVPKDLNCLRIVDCISGVNNRCKHLRSAVAYQILVVLFSNKATSEEEILNLLIKINVKDKSCDLFRMYIYLLLTENWLLSYPKLEEKPVINEMWGVYLRSCSCLISSTDMRPYASKVRNKASYLLQGPTNK